MDMDEETLRRKLLKFGFNPGPIGGLKHLYLKKLHSLRKKYLGRSKSNRQGRCKPNAAIPGQRNHNNGTILSEGPSNLNAITISNGPNNRNIIISIDGQKIRNATSSIDSQSNSIITISIDTRSSNNNPNVTTSIDGPNNINESIIDDPSNRNVATTSRGQTYYLKNSLQNDKWMKYLCTNIYKKLEQNARAGFEKPTNINGQPWREGVAKTSCTYLLLDPRISKNLFSRACQQNKLEYWRTYIKSIFYVGKGRNSVSGTDSLLRAQSLCNQNITISSDRKLQRILDIWKDGENVVYQQISVNIMPAEAYTYAAAIIDVLGLQHLTNRVYGNYYGVVSKWPETKKQRLGLYLLYKGMKNMEDTTTVEAH